MLQQSGLPLTGRAAWRARRAAPTPLALLDAIEPAAEALSRHMRAAIPQPTSTPRPIPSPLPSRGKGFSRPAADNHWRAPVARRLPA